MNSLDALPARAMSLVFVTTIREREDAYNHGHVSAIKFDVTAAIPIEVHVEFNAIICGFVNIYVR